MQISDETLRGRTVVAADGQTAGEVAGMFIDTSTWTIASLKVKLSKTAAEQLGASHRLLRATTIELSVGMIQSVGDTVLLSVPTLGLRADRSGSRPARGKSCVIREFAQDKKSEEILADGDGKRYRGHWGNERNGD